MKVGTELPQLSLKESFRGAKDPPKRAKAAGAQAAEPSAAATAPPSTPEEALKLARETRDLVAQSNQEASRAHRPDVKRLLDLLA